MKSKKIRLSSLRKSLEIPKEDTKPVVDQNEQALRVSLSSDVGYPASNHLEESRHFTGWNYVAVHAKAKQAGQSELQVSYVTIDADGKEVKNPARPDDYWLNLLQKPNCKFAYNWATFVYEIEMQLCLTGKAAIWVVPNALGFPAEMWVIPTGLMFPSPPNPAYPAGSFYISPVGVYQLFGGTPLGYTQGWLRIDARQLRFIKWPHPLFGWEGVSPLTASGTIIDLAEELDEKTISAMRNSVDVGMVFIAPEGTSEEEMKRMEQYLQSTKAGVANAGKSLITSTMPQRTDRTPMELDYVQGRDQAQRMVMALHQTPPIAAGITEGGSYSALYSALMQFVTLTIQPDMTLVATALQSIFNEYSPTLRVEIEAKQINDPELIDAQLNQDAGHGVITINEYRKERGLPPIEGGDALIGKEAKQPPTSPDANGLPPNAGMAPDGAETGIKRPDQEKSWKRKNDWDEDAHKRASDGKFTSGGGGGGSSSSSESSNATSKHPEAKPQKRPTTEREQQVNEHMDSLPVDPPKQEVNAIVENLPPEEQQAAKERAKGLWNAAKYYLSIGLVKAYEVLPDIIDTIEDSERIYFAREFDTFRQHTGITSQIAFVIAGKLTKIILNPFYGKKLLDMKAFDDFDLTQWAFDYMNARREALGLEGTYGEDVYRALERKIQAKLAEREAE